ncbi:MAG: DNA replication/repair protein RecF, partial [Lentisphaeria bacterium]
KLNENLVSRASEFINQLICIIFSPEDIELVDGSGKVRRRFLDITLSQLNHEYLLALQKFNEALKNRNLLLKSKKINRAVLSSFDKVMVENAAIIYQFRIIFFKQISEIILEKSSIFSLRELNFSVSYLSSLNNLDELSEKKLVEIYSGLLEKNYNRDLERGITHVGPHRDDFIFSLNGKKLRDFGSRGQCRLASLLLRLVTSELFFKENNCDNVVFLVDDVTGELDQEIKTLFFKLLQKGKQVFFAATEVPEIFLNHPDVSFYKVENGEVKNSSLDELVES